VVRKPKSRLNQRKAVQYTAENATKNTGRQGTDLDRIIAVIASLKRSPYPFYYILHECVKTHVLDTFVIGNECPKKAEKVFADKLCSQNL
jgi:hypothetical protein